MESVPKSDKNLWEKFRAWIEANPMRAGLWAAAIVLFIVGLFIPVPPPHVALSGEPIFSDGPAWLTNSLITTIVVDIVIILLAVLATARMNLIPSGLQNFMEMVIEFLFGLAESIAGPRARSFFPWVATIFLFVLISNWSGLIPGVGSIGYYHPEEHAEEAGEHAWKIGEKLALANGKLIVIEAEEAAPLAQAATPEAEEEHGEEAAPEEEHAAEGEAAEEHGPKFVPLFRAPSADLNMTFALAIATMVMVQIWGVRTQGGAYFHKFFNASGENAAMKGISVYVSVLEIISEFSRILAFGFRLFGNIFAGEVVLATMAFLVPFFLPLPFYALEVFVGVIQALVFTMLALVFFTMATISHGHGGHDDHVDAHSEHHALSEAQIDAPPVA
jgi:F-type H+-transporting ATPase subunit a